MLGRRMTTNFAVLLFYSLPASGAALAVGYSGVCDVQHSGDSVVLESCLHVFLFVLGFAAFRWLRHKDVPISKIDVVQAGCCNLSPSSFSSDALADASGAAVEPGEMVKSSVVDAEALLGQLAPQSTESTPTQPMPLTPQLRQRVPGSPVSDIMGLQCLLTPLSAFRDEAVPFSSFLSPSLQHMVGVNATTSTNKDIAAPFAAVLGCCTGVASSASDIDVASTAASTSTTSTSSNSSSGSSSMASEESLGFCSPASHSLSKRTGRRLLKGLAAVLESRLAACSSSTPPVALRPWRRTEFHSTETWSLSIADYLFELFWYFECSSACLPIALAYIDRVHARDTRVAFDHQSGHKLLLTSLVLALKFHDDDPPYYNTFYAEFGGVRKEELNALERQFCKLIDWKFAIQPEEYDCYYHILLESA